MTARLLPSRLEDLRGLRARRYVRVSSEEQSAKYGPERQDQECEGAIARLGLVESGPAFVDGQSAWSKSDERPALRELVTAAAAGAYDVLVVAYVSRWSRDTEVALRVRRELHAAGVVILFVDEWFVSSDLDAHERFIQEAAAAEIYSAKLSRTIRRTFATKFDRYGDQAGSPGLGFMRTPQPEARLAIDPATMPRAIAIFERYARGDLSYRELAIDQDVSEAAVRTVLTNPMYNGWAVRHRRRADLERRATPWRSSPPVSDELWARCVAVRETRAKNAGSPRARRTYLLAKRLWCACGRSIPADGAQQRNGSIIRRYRHEGCALGGQVTWKAERYEDPIIAQVTAIRVDARLRARLRSLAGQPVPATTDLRRGQLEAELRTKATTHAARRLTTEAYLAEHERISAEIDALADVRGPELDPDRVTAWLSDLARAWKWAAPEARVKLVASIYERVTVHAGTFLSAKLTPEAEAHGLLLAMPETVELARPAGAGSTRYTVRIPLEGRRAWLTATRRSA